MKASRSALFLLFALMAFGTSVAIFAEDFAETAYDESQPIPVQIPVLNSNGTPISTSGTDQAMPIYSAELTSSLPVPFTGHPRLNAFVEPGTDASLALLASPHTTERRLR